MKKLLTYLLSAMMIFAVGCSEEFDDTAIWEKLNSLESRVAALEQLCKQMNTNITSLQSIVEALQNKDYVTSVAPITEDGKTIGYTITFSKSGAVTIYHGKDGKDGQNGANGKDGYTPTIGVAKASDGKYYWTLDGNWLTDNYGNKIKAEGRDGKDGQDGADGITPKLKIENDYWYVSYDDGKTWTKLGRATGDDGTDGEDGKDSNSMFRDVTYDDNYVYITFADGTKVTVPRYNAPMANEIWYTSSDGKIVTPTWNVNEAKIVSNVYKDGKGIITFDKSLRKISGYAFRDCSNLTSVTMPEEVVEIGEYAFLYCTGLKNVTIPEGLTIIGSCAFSRCEGLTSLNIPITVTQIGKGAFNSCSNLASITIPEGVTSINESLFRNCSNLINITLPNSITSIGDYAFCLCSNLQNITIPKGVIHIGASAFNSCSSMKNIIIPEGVTHIKDLTFANCTSFTDITIPNSVTEIGANAFSQCSSLISITISKNIQSIGSVAFNLCLSLKDVFCRSTTPPKLNGSAFFSNNAPDRKFYVPNGSIEAYKTADGWKAYADKIFGYDF